METVLVGALGLVCLGLLTVAIQTRPWQTLLSFGAFLLVKDYLGAVISNPWAREALKNADEFFIWYYFGLAIVSGSGKRFDRTDLWAFVLLTAGVAASLLNRVTPVVALSDIVLMFKFYAVFRSVSLRNFDPGLFSGLARLVFAAGGVFLGIGIVEVLFPGPMKSLLWGDALSSITVDERFGIVSANGLFTHPGNYGWFMSVAASFAIAHFFILHRRGYLLVFGLFMTGIFLSARRKPLVGIVMAIGWFVAVKYRRLFHFRRSVVAGILVLLVLFGVTFQSAISESVASAVETYFQSESVETQARNVLYLFSAQIAVDYFPFGVGFGRFGGYISMKYYSDVYTQYGISRIWGLTGNESDASFGMDTFWPYVLGELGIAGFVAFCALMALIYRRLTRALGSVEGEARKVFITCALLTLLESFFESVASPVFASSTTVFFIFVPAALAQRSSGS